MVEPTMNLEFSQAQLAMIFLNAFTIFVTVWIFNKRQSIKLEHRLSSIEMLLKVLSKKVLNATFDKNGDLIQ